MVAAVCLDNPTTVGHAPVWEDWRPLETTDESTISEHTVAMDSGDSWEATNLVIHHNGQVELVADSRVPSTFPYCDPVSAAGWNTTIKRRGDRPYFITGKLEV